MARDYTITAARNAGEKPNPHGGTLVKWYLNLADSEAGDDDVYVQKKPGNDLSPGMTIYGRLEKGEFGWRIFPEQNPNAGSSGGNFKAPSYQKEGMTKDGYWEAKDERDVRRERRDVESQARMGRAHAQEMALMREANLIADGKGACSGVGLMEQVDHFHQDVQRFPLDADVGGGSTDSHVLRGHTAADVSAEPESLRDALANHGQDFAKHVEASPAQKRKLTTLFNEAQIAREAQKAIVLYRCRSEKATKDGASQLITDLLEGATHDQLIAEVHDAARAGDAVAIRARKLIPSDTPVDDGSLPELDEPVPDGDSVPF